MFSASRQISHATKDNKHKQTVHPNAVDELTFESRVSQGNLNLTFPCICYIYIADTAQEKIS